MGALADRLARDAENARLLAEYDAQAPLREVRDAIEQAAALLSLLRRDESRDCWVLWSEVLERAQLMAAGRVSSPEKLIEKLAAADRALLASMVRQR